MVNLYKNEDIQDLKKQRNKWLLITALSVIPLLVAAYFIKDTIPILGYVFAVIDAVLLVFFISNYLAPITRYKKMVNFLLTGKNSNFRADILEVGEKAKHKDNLLRYYELFAYEEIPSRADPMQMVESRRLLYWDENLGKPQLEAGKSYDVTIHDKIILSYEEIAEEK